jgi:hypothetical protein
MINIQNYQCVRFLEREFGGEFFNAMHKPIWVYVTVCYDPHKVDWAFRLNGRPENEAVTIFKVTEGRWIIKFIVPPSANYQLNFNLKKGEPITFLSWEEYEKEPVN